MAQFARPDGQLAIPGFWTNATGGTTNIWQNIDESTANDLDYIKHDAATSEEYAVTLGNVSDPVSSSDHTIRLRASGDNFKQITVRLKQGATTKATWAFTPGALAQHSYTLSGAEADSITDYNDLRLSFETGGFASEVRVTWAEFEVPDAPEPATVTPGVIARSATLPAAAKSAGSTPTPSAIARAVALPASSPSASASRSPAAIARSATLPAAAVGVGAGPSPSAIARSAAVPVASLSAGSAVSPAALAAIASLPLPTAVGFVPRLSQRFVMGAP